MKHLPECGKLIDLDLGANLAIDASLVPSNLQFLIPFVNKWAFENSHDQDVFVAHMMPNRSDEIDALNDAFDSNARRMIREWSATLPFDKHVEQFTADDWQHPYWQFLHVIKLQDATPPRAREDNAQIQAVREKVSLERRAREYAEATSEADNLFRDKDFASYTRLLDPFADLLTKTQERKLAIARKRCSS